MSWDTIFTGFWNWHKCCAK